MKSNLHIKRVYEEPSQVDGYRILVDRLWPRGLSKQKAEVDCWMKDIAPSSELRKWFSHDPAKWKKFQERYFMELSVNPALINLLNTIKLNKKTTLLYAAKDIEHNHALVLKMYVEKKA